MIKNKLNDFLKNMKPDEMIYLGMKDGSNFIAIDTAENLINGELKKLESSLRNSVEKTLAKSETSLNSIPKKIVETQEDIVRCRKVESKNDLKVKLETLQKRFVMAYNCRTRCKSMLKKWKKLPNRLVIDSYHRTVDIPGIVVLVEGVECGTMWFKSDDKGDSKNVIARA